MWAPHRAGGGGVAGLGSLGFRVDGAGGGLTAGASAGGLAGGAVGASGPTGTAGAVGAALRAPRRNALRRLGCLRRQPPWDRSSPFGPLVVAPVGLVVAVRINAPGGDYGPASPTSPSVADAGASGASPSSISSPSSSVLRVARDTDDRVPVLERDQADAHGVAAAPLELRLGDRRPDHAAARGDREHLVALVDHHRADQRPRGARGASWRSMPRPPRPLGGPLVERGALPEATVGEGHQVGPSADDVHGEQLVPVPEPHPDDPGRGPAHRAQLSRRCRGSAPTGPCGTPGSGRRLADEPRRDELVVLAQVDRDEAAGAGSRTRRAGSS